MTFEIAELNFEPFVYYIGATDGWANAEQKLALTDEANGIYTGFIYCAGIILEYFLSNFRRAVVETARLF